jgi:hypothetical protein
MSKKKIEKVELLKIPLSILDNSVGEFARYNTLANKLNEIIARLNEERKK